MSDPFDLSKHAPGVLGSLTAMFLVKDTWPRRIGLFVAGVAAAYYGGGWTANQFGADPELAGYLVGLFSMGIAAKAYETLESIQPKELWDRILKRLGL